MNDLCSISNSDTLQRQLPEFPPFPSKFFILSWIFANICLAQRTNLSSNFFLTSSSYRSKLLQLRKQIFWCLQLSFDVPPNFSSFLHVALNLWSISSVIILSIEVERMVRCWRYLTPPTEWTSLCGHFTQQRLLYWLEMVTLHVALDVTISFWSNFWQKMLIDNTRETSVVSLN